MTIEYVYNVITVKTEDGWTKVPTLGPNDQLYGYKVENPSFYRLNFIFTNDNKDKDVTPEIVTVILPEIVIDGELHKIEPIRFESTWTVQSIIDPM